MGEIDPGGPRPEVQGFRSVLLARLAWPWVAGPGCVYPGRVLPEQMGARQCHQPGAGLTSSQCQVAGDSGAWGETCVWFGCLQEQFLRAESGLHAERTQPQLAWDTVLARTQGGPVTSVPADSGGLRGLSEATVELYFCCPILVYSRRRDAITKHQGLAA